MLDFTLLPITQFDFDLLLADTRCLPTKEARFRVGSFAFTGLLATYRARLGWLLLADARGFTTLLADFRVKWLAIPFRVYKKMVGIDEIVDGEVVLSIEKPSPSPNYLFEFNH